MDTTMSRTETVLSEIKKDHDKARPFAKIDAESVNWDDVKELYISLKDIIMQKKRLCFQRSSRSIIKQKSS